MAYYDHYRNAPGWGTSSYQFLNPQAPSYQPQPNWGGLDYFRAHGGIADPSIYDHAWDRVRSYPNIGVGIDEARHWHRRAYGGLGDIVRMLPSDIGAAAAYEVWRNWKHNYGIYGAPLAGDRDRQREAIIGLACGEATRLWNYTGRSGDNYGRLEAVEAAAGTASRIFIQSWTLESEGMYDAPYDGRLSRRASMAALPSYAGSGSAYSGSAYGGASPYAGSVYAGSAFSDNLDPYDSYDAYNGGVGAYQMRRRSLSGTLTPGYAYSAPAGTSYYGTPMTTTMPYNALPPASTGYGAYPQTPNLTIIQAPSDSHRHRHRHRSRSRHGHRSRSRHHHHQGSPSVYYTSTPVSGYGY